MRTKLVRSEVAALLALRARALRGAPTDSEQMLWRALRSRQLLGVRFRRQAPIGGFMIADFVARKQRLVVEVDGPYHGRRRSADARRDRKLLRLGFRVLRLDAELVIQNLGEALALIRAALGEPPEVA
jgi:very-short-patch-repair endonuclease